MHETGDFITHYCIEKLQKKNDEGAKNGEAGGNGARRSFERFDADASGAVDNDDDADDDNGISLGDARSPRRDGSALHSESGNKLNSAIHRRALQLR